MILSVINNKGGTGKTTTAVNLAAALAMKGRQTLLIDLDSQASASLSLGISRADFHPSSATVILGEHGIDTAIRQTDIEGLDLVTGSPDLADADIRLARLPGRERRLNEDLVMSRAVYDFVVMDCPPSLGLLAVNSLVAADAYIIPTPPEYLALEGLIGLLEAVQRIHEGIGTRSKLAGILLTKVDHRRKVTEEIIQVIRRHYRDQVFRTEIGVDVRLIEAPAFGQTIFQYDRGSAGAEAYRQLADEIIRRKGRTP